LLVAPYAEWVLCRDVERVSALLSVLQPSRPGSDASLCKPLDNVDQTDVVGIFLPKFELELSQNH